MTDQDIFERLRAILIETFDIEAARITPQARLYEDLDIDSIDAVDLIVRLKPLVGKRLQPEAFKTVRTLQDVINALQGLMQAEPGAVPKVEFEGATAPTNS
jgi:acyl carrier protein